MHCNSDYIHGIRPFVKPRAPRQFTMKHFINWLYDRFVPGKPIADHLLRQTGSTDSHLTAVASCRKSGTPLNTNISQALEFSSEVGGEMVDGGPGKNVPTRIKYIREDSGTHETLKIVDESLPESAEELGLDPYNTGRFDPAESWNSSRSRK